MTRAVPEWIGKTDDSAIPPRVRLRVFERHGGICHISGRRIGAGEAWDCDHIIALANGGSHRESNLGPALVAPHKIKTKLDLKQKSKDYCVRAKYAGIKRAKSKIKSAGFQKSRPQRTASRPIDRWTP